jgi:hypothetical protein
VLASGYHVQIRSRSSRYQVSVEEGVSALVVRPYSFLRQQQSPEREMRLARLLPVGFLSVGLVAGCGGDDGTGPSGITMAELVGSWDAVEVVFTNLANPSETMDLVALGADVTLTASSGGDFALVMMLPGEGYQVQTGVVSVQGGRVVIEDDDDPGEPGTFSADLDGNLLTLELVDGEVEIDFDDDGVDDPADLRLVLGRLLGLTVLDLGGQWAATEFRFVSDPGATDTIDVLEEGGSLTLNLVGAGSYIVNVSVPGEPPETERGTLLREGEELVLISEDDPMDPTVFTFIPFGDRLELEGESEIDFDGDDVDDPAIMEILLERQ